MTGWHYFYAYQRGASAWLTSPDTCDDEGARQAVEKQVHDLVMKGAKIVQVNVREVEYVLWSGRNWGGSIDNFKLHIIKNWPNQIVSLCFPGRPIHLDQETIEFSQKNYVPQDRLRVNFYTVND